MPETFYFVNGSFVKKENAFIHVNDIGLLRGYAVFDYFKTYYGKPFRLNDHLERLKSSASLIGLTIPFSLNEIGNICYELLRRNNFKESNIRVVITGGVGADSKTKGEPGVIITCEPRVEWDDSFYDDGVKIKTVTGKRDLFLSKTTNYIKAIDYIAEFKPLGFSEYLYVFDELVYECTSSNIYIIRGGKLLTPEEGVLRGVTRKVIFEIAKSILPCEVCNVKISEVLNADEVFISSTEREIMPVTTINETTIGNGRPGKYTLKLLEGFRNYIKSKSWISD